MICALAMLTAMMPSAVWAETPVPETTVITEEASEPTATPAATEQPVADGETTTVDSNSPTDTTAQPTETPAVSPAPYCHTCSGC